MPDNVTRYGVTDCAEERPLGPWLKLYADVVDRKAHYTDRQFRVLVEVLALAVRLRGVLPERRALAARVGQSELDFLFSEGDLEETDDGKSVVIHRWKAYQADPTNAERQRRFRNAHSPLPVTKNASATSISSSTAENVERAVPSDPLLEALMSVGGVPSKRAMDWVAEMAAEFGEDATIRALGTAALEGPVKVLSRAQSALKASVIRRDRAESKRKEAELAQARTDRMASRRVDPGPVDPRPLAAIVKELQT